MKHSRIQLYDKEMKSWGVEVEPPEHMDETDYDVDPSMKIWKSMAGNGLDKQHLKAKEEMYHLSLVDIPKDQIQNLDTLPADDAQDKNSEEESKYQEAEEDKDDIDHPVFVKVISDEPEQDWDEIYHKAREQINIYLAPLVAKYKDGTEIRASYSEPEKDEDYLYHHDDQSSLVQVEPLRREVRVHIQPEEDMDVLYHKDPQLVPYQDDAKAAAPVELPSQRKYSEPEEDLDHFDHH
ncbi:uncharacterized protein LOC113131550 isoform X2 [Mastacembelus armatus]|uniref:uncharacterized protein LOC113131550 isoform X2 n=1 Tax=Mastacembelus armatus TaxID=205130 RepID=UPI000E4544CD|nr:uncharacterized protein LOC113131550 isoform X2 [Mastacembelus armatus]